MIDKKQKKKQKSWLHHFDGNTFYLSLPVSFGFITCCDCGLRHLFVVEGKGDKLQIGFIRDEEGTRIARNLYIFNKRTHKPKMKPIKKKKAKILIFPNT